MIGRNLRYLVALATCALLPLAGCSGGGSTTKITEKGTEVTVGGKLDVATAKTTAKTAIAANTVEVTNAQDGAVLGTAALDSNGAFTGLTFTLPATKTILVFKATVAQGTFLSVVPIDLSNPPAAGAITGANPISIVISQESTNRALLVSQLLGLTGDLGDAGQTLASVNKTYADAAALVVNNGGQQLAYSGSGLALSGKFSSAALLPALDANDFGTEDLNNMTLDGAVSSVSIPGSKPIVSFQVTNKATGKGIRGLKNFNLVIAQLKPGTDGSPDQWLSYMVTPTAVTSTALVSLPGRPSTDAATASTITVSAAGVTPAVTVPIEAYTVIDNGDGSYTVIFGKNIKTAAAINQGFGPTYDANLTHRVMVGVRSTPSVALQNNGSNLSNFYNEKYLVKDFIPATPDVVAVSRDMTTTEACNECHGKIGVTTPHGGRGDVRYCMMCHTSQRANGRTNLASVGGAIPARDPLLSASSSDDNFVADGEVFGDFVTMIHKIHMGNKLTKTGYDYAGVAFNSIHYPKDVRNCRQCHKGDTAGELALAPQANNWKTKPSRKSCGSCHDGVNFATGAGHSVNNLPQPTDANCVGCHGDADLLHQTEIATPNNPNTPVGLTNFYYEVNTVSVVESGGPPATSSVATIKFRIQKNTGSLTATKENVVFTGAGTSSTTIPVDAVLAGFSGSPSFLLAYYQDTTNQPEATNVADYNNLRGSRTDTGAKAAQPITVSIATLLNGAKGTLSAPDVNGYYTATLSGAANNFPVGSKLRAVGLQGYFTQEVPTGGIAVKNARHALSSVKAVTGDARRRDVIDSAKCGNCHEWFEGHGGNRVVGKDTVGDSICTLCHVPNLTTSGRGAQKSLIEFIIAQPLTTSLNAVTNFLTGVAFPVSTSNVVTQEAKDAMTALVASLGSDPTQYPEASNNFKDMIHGIHAGSDPLIVGTPLAFVRDRGASGDFDYNFSTVVFPGVLKNCTMCHKGTTYTTIPEKVQVSTQVTTRGTALTLQTDVAVGNNVTEVDAARKAVPNPQDIVSTPFAATCKACHNKPNALAHFSQNGGQINVLRSQANPAGESCVTCHGTTGPNALFNVHRFSVVGDD